MLYILGTNNGKLKEGAFNDKSTLPNSGILHMYFTNKSTVSDKKRRDHVSPIPPPKVRMSLKTWLTCHLKIPFYII